MLFAVGDDGLAGLGPTPGVEAGDVGIGRRAANGVDGVLDSGPIGSSWTWKCWRRWRRRRGGCRGWTPHACAQDAAQRVQRWKSWWRWACVRCGRWRLSWPGGGFYHHRNRRWGAKRPRPTGTAGWPVWMEVIEPFATRNDTPAALKGRRGERVYSQSLRLATKHVPLAAQLG